ncbi:MAG TPA: hypothetical protein PKE22_05135 [Ottowia sp.]|nr:hypothetical protein [Ottowia sp.]HMT64215.1 hypothetical protein [Ottowia sp.]HMT82423.1 hypothetical protein [Ottowia sp.]HOK12494.1 hypothetical protein [Ottowia sp.]HOM20618.1 hypothetical protein [Ottowia sp.]
MTGKRWSLVLLKTQAGVFIAQPAGPMIERKKKAAGHCGSAAF